jgi:hypothetical protein
MATVEDCRDALERLTRRISQLDPADRAAHLADRDVSCEVTDLGVTFVARLGPDGAGPVTQANGASAPAQIKFKAASGDLLRIADDPGQFPRAWLTGRVKVDASIFDLVRLRKLL